MAATKNKSGCDGSVALTPGLMHRTITICVDCYELKGDMCHTPECVFCRKTMAEIADMLDALLIRPVVDDKRLILRSIEPQSG